SSWTGRAAASCGPSRPTMRAAASPEWSSPGARCIGCRGATSTRGVCPRALRLALRNFPERASHPRLLDRQDVEVSPLARQNWGAQMFSRIMYVTVFVSDQDKALDFYTKSFGFQKRADYNGREGRFLTIALKDQGFEVLL